METNESGVALPSGPDGRKRRVSYFYEPMIGDYYYGQGHPIKPHRIHMAHIVIVHYNLHRRLEISRPNLADASDIGRFHTPEYVDFLASVSSETIGDPSTGRNLRRFNIGEDYPVFDGLFDFFRASAGGSIGAPMNLNRQDADISINWGGGLHHAKKSEAYGFCYVNDIVLGILELLKMFRLEDDQQDHESSLHASKPSIIVFVDRSSGSLEHKKRSMEAILHCRHMCMCSGCAKLLRFQTNLCPICRQPVDRFLEIKVNTNGANH